MIFCIYQKIDRNFLLGRVKYARVYTGGTGSERSVQIRCQKCVLQVYKKIILFFIFFKKKVENQKNIFSFCFSDQNMILRPDLNSSYPGLLKNKKFRIPVSTIQEVLACQNQDVARMTICKNNKNKIIIL